ncbi:MAG: glycosyltransferase family 2 protein [Vicinamibacterales bacterium]
MTPRVAVVVATCNGRRHLEECLPSLEALDYPRGRFEVVVIDNGSSDGSSDWVGRNHPHVRLLRLDRNIGFAPAYNLASRNVEADFLAFLNDDTRVHPRWLSEMASAAERHSASCVGSVILDWDGRKIDFAGGITSIAGHAWSDRANQPASQAPQSDEPLLFACGGSMLVESVAFRDAGGFDEDYFAYFEDVDLGWRLSLAGHRVVLSSRAITYHRLHGTAGGWAFSQRLRLYERNALFTIFKCLEDETLAAALPASTVMAIARGLRYSSLPREQLVFGHSMPGAVPVAPQTMATLLALEEFAVALPRLKEKRARVQASRRVSDRDLFPLFRDVLHVHELGDPYESMARALYETFDLARLAAGGPSSGGRSTASPAQPPIAEEHSAPVSPRSANLCPSRREPPFAEKQSSSAGAGTAPDECCSSPIAQSSSIGPVQAPPRVSVVILTALGPRHLPACLDSLRAQSYPADLIEVIVVDNGSAEDPSTEVRARYPGARVLRLGGNTGFSAGNNAGARVARGRYLVFLNDDTRSDPGLLAALVKAAADHGAAAVGARILSWDGSRVDFAGGGMNFYGKGFQSGVGAAHPERYAADRPVLFACGAAMLVDRDVFLSVGGFDEGLFAYYEDLALGWRLWLEGHEVWFAGSAVVYHLHHGTSGRWSKAPVLRCYERNSLMTLFKHDELATLERTLPPALLLAAERALIHAGLSSVADEQRIPRASALRRLYWRLQPRALARQVKGDLAGRGASWRNGFAGSLKQVGPAGLARSAVELVKFVSRDDLKHLNRRWAYFMERGAQDRSFDARPEAVTPETAAVLVALDDFCVALAGLAGERRDIQAARKRSDAEIVGRFPDHWVDADATARQLEYGRLVNELAASFGVAAIARNPRHD